MPTLLRPAYLSFLLFSLGCDDSLPSRPEGTGGGSSGGAASMTGGSMNGGASQGMVGEKSKESDVCAFPAATPPLEVDADGFHVIPPTHSSLWYMGRVDCGAEGGPRFGFPGVSIRVRFSGSALKATFVDSSPGTETAKNFIEVIADGAEPKTLELSPGKNEVTIVEGLPDEEHEVLIWKRTESSPGGTVNAGVLSLAGLRFLGSELLEAKGPARRIEFIGDSITCGYGNEVSTTTPDDFHFTAAAENNYAAYGAVTARLLDADYMGVSYSGKGMSQNYAGGGGETVPDFYLDIIPDDSTAPAWEPSRFTPHAVVVNVATNDYSTVAVDQALFVAKYTEFLATLRNHYPEALLVAALGPMLSDFYPVGAKAWTNAQAGVKEAVEARRAAGDSNVEIVTFSPQTSPYGEDWHPTAATHQKMAEQLSEVLRAKLGW